MISIDIKLINYSAAPIMNLNQFFNEYLKSGEKINFHIQLQHDGDE